VESRSAVEVASVDQLRCEVEPRREKVNRDLGSEGQRENRLVSHDLVLEFELQRWPFELGGKKGLFVVDHLGCRSESCQR